MLHVIEFLIDIIQFTMLIQLGVMILLGKQHKVPMKKIILASIITTTHIQFSREIFVINNPLIFVDEFTKLLTNILIYKYLTQESLIRSLGINIFISFLALPCYLFLLLIIHFMGLLEIQHLGLLASCLFTPYFFFLVKYLKKDKDQNIFDILRSTYNKFAWFFASFSLATPILLIIYGIGQKYTDYFVETLQLLYTFAALVLIITLAYLVSKLINAQNLLNNQVSTLSEYTKTINTLHSDIRLYKNDVSMILLSMKTYVDKCDTEGLDHYLTEHIEGIQGFNLESYKTLSHLQHLKIKSIKGLIFNKFHQAQDLGVLFQAGIIEELVSLDIKDVDICRMLGILLDNAIEAAHVSEEKKVQVIFDKVTHKNRRQWQIEVINSYKGNIMPSGISGRWKSSKGKGHGIGLKSLHIIIKRYKHVTLKTLVDKQIVTQTLIFDFI